MKLYTFAEVLNDIREFEYVEIDGDFTPKIMFTTLFSHIFQTPVGKDGTYKERRNRVIRFFSNEFSNIIPKVDREPSEDFAYTVYACEKNLNAIHDKNPEPVAILVGEYQRHQDVTKHLMDSSIMRLVVVIRESKMAKYSLSSHSEVHAFSFLLSFTVKDE